MNERHAEERALLLQNPYITNEKSPPPSPLHGLPLILIPTSMIFQESQSLYK